MPENLWLPRTDAGNDLMLLIKVAFEQSERLQEAEKRSRHFGAEPFTYKYEFFYSLFDLRDMRDFKNKMQMPNALVGMRRIGNCDMTRLDIGAVDVIDRLGNNP